LRHAIIIALSMNRSPASPFIAITVGDPAGVGPEIVAKTFGRRRPARSSALVIGAASVLPKLLLRAPDVACVSPEEVPGLPARHGRLYIVDTGCRAKYRPGRDTRGGGEHAGKAIDVACRLARANRIRAIVTAPISKRALAMAGYHFTGHTEMLATRLKAPDCQMMMVYRDLRVIPVTRHLPIKRVSRALTQERIVTALTVVDRSLREQFHVTNPRIAVCGLNPHAGEGGTLGSEEQETIVPAIRRARRRGIDITGPVAADALFQEARSGTFDAFLAMYHDQGLVPFKMLARRRGVNVTIGLPVVRTSVDHGVAYDIAGRGIATGASLLAAYRLAEKLTTGR
jgi:4-hydroxythreonine-4-phosphate dehydrogenase